MRLIDAGECTSAETLKSFPVFEEAGANVLDLKELIASCKTLDAAPVVHGEWEEGFFRMRCSSCKNIALYNIFGYYEKSRFCPNCGARMDLK